MLYHRKIMGVRVVGKTVTDIIGKWLILCDFFIFTWDIGIQRK